MSDTKISALTTATTVNAADLVPIVQGGTNKSAAFSLFGPPFAMVQSAYMPYTHNSNPTLTFPATGTSGNTLFLAVNYAANSSAMTTPSGWTQKVSTAASDTDSNVTLYTKASAGSETSITLAGNAFYTAIFFELVGSRTVTIHSQAAATATAVDVGGYVNAASFTPSAGAMVFALCAATSGTVTVRGDRHQAVLPADPLWYTSHVSGNADNPRMLTMYIYQRPASGSAMLAPAWAFYDLFSMNVAYATFSVT